MVFSTPHLQPMNQTACGGWRPDDVREAVNLGSIFVTAAAASRTFYLSIQVSILIYALEAVLQDLLTP